MKESEVVKYALKTLKESLESVYLTIDSTKPTLDSSILN